MKKETILEAESEARRFLKRLESLKKTDGYKEDYIVGCTASGAVKRASMDLTRALAKLRKY